MKLKYYTYTNKNIAIKSKIKNMTIESKIQKIKDKRLFGNLVEVGAGCPVYAELCNHANTASKIINTAFSPNNWEWSKKHYEHGSNRAVSSEVAENLIKSSQGGPDENINFVLTNTIQISNTSDVQTHGWFALYTSGRVNYYDCKLYHFTINGFRTRKEYIEIMAYIGIDILAAYNEIEELDNGYIDSILDSTRDGQKPNIKSTLTSILNGKLNIEHLHNTTTVLRAFRDIDTYGNKGNYTIDRLNTLLRQDLDNLCIIKGSFNPIHPQHIALLDAVYKSIELLIPCNKIKKIFCISLYNRDTTKKIDIDNLMKRIDLIHALGYDVIIDCFGQYHYSYTSIINNVDYKKEMNIHYVMGSDIIQRFLQDEGVTGFITTESVNKFNDKWNHCTFWWDKRPGFQDFKINSALKNIEQLTTVQKELSSTLIRDLIKEKEYETLKLHVDAELIMLYIEYYGKPE